MKKIYTLIIVLLAFSATIKAQVSEQEFQALKALYNATGGDNWTNRTGWEHINTTATKDDVTTGWYGIGAIENSHVTILNIDNNNMTGTLPAQIGDLMWMQEFALGSNKISGIIPSEIGNLINLNSISLNSNQISGPLPQSMKNLRNLKYLTLSSNPINSEFPGSILMHLTQLENLTIHRCNFSGTIPDIFDSLTQLSYLELESNLLTGEFPPSINRLKNISTISVGSNQLSGNLPSLDSCKLLKNLYLWNNNFSGSIPYSYANFPVLRYFYLLNNNVSGAIPSGIFKPTLQRFWIEQNLFTFEGFEPSFNQLKITSNNHYSTDKLFELKQSSLTVNNGEALTLNASTLSVHNLGGNNNRYKWYRNDVEVYSGNSPIYTVPSSGVTDAGIYRFEVTNTVVTGLTLKSNNVTVSVVGSNRMPTNILLSTSTTDENFNGSVGTLSATDPDASDTHTFALATGNGTNDRDNNRFTINGNQLNINGSANFETSSTLNILISVNDGNGGIFTKAFVIAVNNVNEAPVYNGQVTSNTIDENAANGSTALTLMAQDPEDSPVTFSIIQGNNDGAFGINGNKLVVADNTKFNYDVKNSYPLMVNASDGILSSNAILTINLNKINSMPQVEDAVFSIDENSAVGTVVGSIVASDREGDPLTLSFLTGNELSAFTFSGKNIVVANSDHLDYEQHPVFNITFNVSDGISNIQATVIINLKNVEEPTDNAIATFSVPGMVGEPEIDYVAHTIRAFVSGVDLRSLAADFTLSSNATSNPSSGATFDFSSPQTITVTSQTSTSQDWVITVTFRVGKDELNNKKVKLYPNPISNCLHISGLKIGSKMKIVTITGQTVLSSVSTSDIELLDLSNINPGNYLIIINSTNKTFIQKIIKK
jgi:Leucine-rich repeat (LRR) protein